MKEQNSPRERGRWTSEAAASPRPTTAGARTMTSPRPDVATETPHSPPPVPSSPERVPIRSRRKEPSSSQGFTSSPSRVDKVDTRSPVPVARSPEPQPRERHHIEYRATDAVPARRSNDSESIPLGPSFHRSPPSKKPSNDVPSTELHRLSKHIESPYDQPPSPLRSHSPIHMRPPSPGQLPSPSKMFSPSMSFSKGSLLSPATGPPRPFSPSNSPVEQREPRKVDRNLAPPKPWNQRQEENAGGSHDDEFIKPAEALEQARKERLEKLRVSINE